MRLANVFPTRFGGYWGAEWGAADCDALAIRNGDVGVTGELRWDGLAKRSFTFREFTKAEVHAGDIVLTTSGNCGNVAFVPREPTQPTVATNFVRVLRVDPDKTDAKYAFHFLRTDKFASLISPFIRGATIKNLSVEAAFGAVTMPHPVLSEQRRIAAILDHADALRAKRRLVLAHLNSITQAIFLDMFGDPDQVERSQPFCAVADLQGGRNLVAEDSAANTPYRVLKISAVTSGEFKAAESKPLPADYRPPSEHLVRDGDLLMSRANTTEKVGAVAYVDVAPSNLCLPDKVWRFVWKTPSEPRYYQALLSTSSLRRRISRLSSGTGGSMKNVSKAKLSAMPIPEIAYADQQEFAIRLEALDQQRAASRRAAAAADDLFASLQSRAFRGEL